MKVHERLAQPEPVAEARTIGSGNGHRHTSVAPASRARRYQLPGRVPAAVTTARWLAVVAGASAAAAGIVVLAGWFTRTAELVRTGPDVTPTQPNAALGIAALGFAVIALALRARLVPIVGAAVAIAIGVITLLEDLLDVALIDELYVDAFVVVGDGAPGRPAPNTALALALLGIGVLGVHRHRSVRVVQRWVVGTVAIVGSLGVVSLYGYASGLPSAYGWGDVTAMAPQAALALLILSFGLLAAGSNRSQEGLAHLAPLPIGIGGLSLVLLLWRALLAEGDVDGHISVTEADQAILLIGVVVAALFVIAMRFAGAARSGRLASERLLDDLRASERRLADFLDHAETAAYTKDLDGRYVMVNANWLRAVGRQRHEVIGRTTPEVLGDTVAAERIVEHDREVLTTRRPVEYEERVQLPHGERIYLSTRFPLLTPGGEVYGVAGTSVDITERTRQEEALRRSESRFRAVIDAMQEGVIVRGPDRRIMLANSSAGRMLGVPAEVLVGLDAEADWGAVHEDGTAFAGSDDPLMVAMDEDRPVDDVVMGVQRLDGSMVWLDVSARPVPSVQEGEGLEGVVSLHDITELRAQRMQLEDRARELERSNEELAQFAYVASHDLSEPLRSIGGFASLLSQRYSGQLDDEADEFLQFIRSGVSQMQALIDDLLAFSRVDTRARPFEPTDVGRVARDSLERLHDALVRAGAVVDIGELPTVQADGRQLAQVFQNLVANAVVYRSQDVPPRISVTADRIEGAWRFVVGDNGIGIDPRHRERIFRMFQRLNPRHEYSGSGIGLAICKKIVERHGGTIWVEGAPGEGSRFCFTIPDRDPSPTDTEDCS